MLQSNECEILAPCSAPEMTTVCLALSKILVWKLVGKARGSPNVLQFSLGDMDINKFHDNTPNNYWDISLKSTNGTRKQSRDDISRTHPPGKYMSVKNFMASHQIVGEIIPAGPKWWTKVVDQPTLPSLEPHHLRALKSNLFLSCASSH